MEFLRDAMRQDWSVRPAAEALRALDSRPEGLTPAEAEARQRALGPNEIAQGKPTPWYIVLGRQFQSPLIYILLAAAVVTALFAWQSGDPHELNDVVIILAVLIINAGIGFNQERKAERAINNIKGMAAPHCRVRRGGEPLDLLASDLVPGDVLLLEEGDRVPADARLLASTRLRVEEAIFTGESCAAAKQIEPLTAPGVLADRVNLVFMGTHVTAGRAEAVVTATAMSTELGRIAGLVQTAEEVLTPLQKKLEVFSQMVAKAVLAICSLIFVSGWLHGQSPREAVMTSIALAVSAIPEGLPVVITLVLAIGVRRMAVHNALIRKLPTVETLGSATVICTDKTGTLTRNEMVATRLFLGGQDGGEYLVTGDGYQLGGEIRRDGMAPGDDPRLSAFLATAVLCNNASLREGPDGTVTMVGDGTEGALMALAGKRDRALLTLRAAQPRTGEVPFDSRQKFMVTLHRDGGRQVAHMKGSLEAVLARCHGVMGNDGSRRPLSAPDRERLAAINLGYAGEALRVLGLAQRDVPLDVDINTYVEGEQKDFVFLGLVGMIDLPRTEAIDAVARCRRAGIKVVMITGDHAATAQAVGRRVGLFDDGMAMFTGEDLQKLDERALFDTVEKVAIYARTSPEDKMRIVKALQSHEHVVCMTGDGVNDAPALTRADIGVAMGRSGTDVAREAAGMVLADDNFAAIVAAVEEGRIIFNNLRKAIAFLLSTNAGEVLTLLAASLAGMPTPLRAVQILWVNLVTDSFTTIALGVDPAEGDEMAQPPRSPRETLLPAATQVQIGAVAGLMCLGTLAAYQLGANWPGAESAKTATATAQTMAFAAMVFFQLFNIFNCRSADKSLMQVGFMGNLHLVGAVGLASVLQLAAMYLPFLQRLLGTVSLSLPQLVTVLAITLLVFPAIEVVKLRQRATAAAAGAGTAPAATPAAPARTA